MSFAIATVVWLAYSNIDPANQTSSVEKPTGSSSRALGLVASGAASLGAYEAGFLYFISKHHKRSQENQQPLKLVVGASAGSINALITGLESCQPSPSTPDQSLGWRIWIPIGFENIWDPREVYPNGLLSNIAMETAFEQLITELLKGAPKSCDFVAGFTTTRVHPLDAGLAPGLRVPRQEEKFVVRIQGHGPGIPSSITNYVDPYQEAPMPLLPLSGGSGYEESLRDYSVLSKVLFASAAFPLAFEPVRIPHCLTTPPGHHSFIPRLDVQCHEPTREDEFIDGGIFDNAPLNLAYNLAKTGLRTSASGQPVWRQLEISPWLDRRAPFSDIYFGYVDPWTRAYPELKTPENPRKSTLKYVVDLAANFVGTARARELFSLTKHQESVKQKVLLSRNHFPPSGDLFYAFFGFFERDLRIFDFYLGMYDALMLLREQQPDVPLLVDIDINHKSWQPFACMLGWFDTKHQAWRPACKQKDLYNFRILLQLSMEKIYQSCSKLPLDTIKKGLGHSHCEAAMNGNPPPQLVHHQSETWDHYDLSSTTGLLDRLADLRFFFKDLHLKPSQSRRIRSVMKRRFAQIVDHTAELPQNRAIRGILKVGSSVIANNTLGYESPPWMIPITIGTDAIESGLIFSPIAGTEKWLRLNIALQLRNWTTFLPGSDRYIALSPVFGPEVLLPHWTSGILQPSIGLRAGYQLSSADEFSSKACLASPEHKDHRGCSQLLTQAFIALGIVDRIRLQLLVDFFPHPPGRSSHSSYTFSNYPFQLSISGGLTFF